MNEIDKPAQLPPLVYAVWIPGRGWLKDSNNSAFADVRRKVAETAARMYGPPARIEIVDNAPSAMLALERIFLERENLHARKRQGRNAVNRVKGMLKKWGNKK